MAKLHFASRCRVSSQHTASGEQAVDSSSCQFLTRTNHDFRQSKTDQILRFLHDQDKLNKRFNHCDFQGLDKVADDDEDTLVSDDDTNSENTLSDSSVIKADKNQGGEAPLPQQRQGRAQTSVGFYNDTGIQQDLDMDNTPSMAEPERHIDTRFNRPKSSYVRRRQYVRPDEMDMETSNDVSDEPPPTRISRSARPRSRLGNRPNPDMYKRKIALTEANSNGVAVTESPTALPTTDKLVGANSYDRFASTKTPGPGPSAPVSRLRREKTNVRTFCEDSGKSVLENTSPVGSLDVKEDIVEVPAVKERHDVQVSTLPSKASAPRSAVSQFHTKGSTQQDHSLEFPRPRNPEPITSRPMGRSDVRPEARRRLQRRYRQLQQHPVANVRPTSESVILARQRTEKNLLKAQAANDRPKSERILLQSSNKSMLSVGRNPAQGPQTFHTETEHPQASHVQAGGFRGYNPGSRGKDPARQSLHPELSIPAQRPAPSMVANRRPLTLMKLPPLDAAMAKKTERGLSLARETCV